MALSSPDLVQEAVRYAILEVRQDWSSEYTDWILKLIDLSMRASFAKYKDSWYKAKKGIPTGGSMSVQIANITVFYVLSKCLYSSDEHMSYIHAMKRFIDDGTGIFKGSERQFISWKNTLNSALIPYNLTIDNDSWQYAENGESVNFLDIKFGFDYNGELITDLYCKQTDARAYLHYSSYHTNQTFSSIVYSQAIRIRRIVKDQYKLSKHLDTLKEAFFKAKYPKRMVNNIIEKVKSLPRTLQKSVNNSNDNEVSIRVVSTHGCDKALTETVKKTEKLITSSKIFASKQVKKPYTFTKRVAPSLRSVLCNSKQIGKGPKSGGTKACGKVRCICCPLILNANSVKLNGKIIYPASGNCSTEMVIYGGICSFKSCFAPYVGRTVQPLHKRINGHRSAYGEYCEKRGKLDDNVDLDKYAIGIHLFREHSLNNPSAFDQHIKFFILENCQPKSLDLKEHLWIQKIRSIYPEGMNLNSPFGIPLLY